MDEAVLRRWVGLVVAVLCFVAAVAAVRSGSAAEGVAATESATTAGPFAASTPSPAAPDPAVESPVPTVAGSRSASQPSSGSSAPSSSASPAGARTAGVGLTRTGTVLRASPTSSGDLEVVERVRFAAPVTSVRLELRASPAPALAGVRPQVRDLQIQAGATPVVAPAEGPAEAPVVVRLPATDELTLRYRLGSTAVRSNPAPVGRVLLAVAPIVAPSATSGPVVLDVFGSGVRNLVCPALPQREQTCGARRGAAWTAGPVPARDATFVAQVDLPDPGAP